MAKINVSIMIEERENVDKILDSFNELNKQNKLYMTSIDKDVHQLNWDQDRIRKALQKYFSDSDLSRIHLGDTVVVNKLVIVFSDKKIEKEDAANIYVEINDMIDDNPEEVELIYKKYFNGNFGEWNYKKKRKVVNK